jgi:hypothetical protein
VEVPSNWLSFFIVACNEDKFRIRLVFQANKEKALAITPPFS